MASSSDAQGALQSLTDEYRKLESELQGTIAARQRLNAQHTESLSVQTEFKTLKPESNIYKLIGPVLLKQEPDDARAAVDGRVEFINGEIKRVEGQLKILQEKSETKKNEIYQLQTRLQESDNQASAVA